MTRSTWFIVVAVISLTLYTYSCVEHYSVDQTRKALAQEREVMP